MIDASEPIPSFQYARPSRRPARASRRRVAIFGALLLAVLLPAFVSLGLWQWRKAEAKTALQTELDQRSHDAAIALPTLPAAAADIEALRHRRVSLHGRYDAARQVLIDNRTHREQAGYHVVTPLQLEGSTMHVLVNRGWVPAPADHTTLPAAPVPAGPVEVTGIAVVPASRFFNLAPQPTTGWSAVWQNLDLERFRSAVPYPLQPLVVQLDAASPDGFVREWPRPDERADRHRSYALQWFGFALSSLGIWLYFLVRCP